MIMRERVIFDLSVLQSALVSRYRGSYISSDRIAWNETVYSPQEDVYLCHR